MQPWTVARSVAIAAGVTIVFIYLRGGWDDRAALIWFVTGLGLIGLVSGRTVDAADRLLGTTRRALARRGVVTLLGVAALTWPMGRFLVHAGFAALPFLILFAIAVPAFAVLVAGRGEVVVGVLTAMTVPGSFDLARLRDPVIQTAAAPAEWTAAFLLLYGGSAVISLGASIPIQRARRRSKLAASDPADRAR